MGARLVVLLTHSKSSHLRQLLSRRHYAPVSPLSATLLDFLASVANKRVRAHVSPLDASLKKQEEAPAAFLGSSASKHPAKSAMPPGKLFAHLSNIGQLWGFAAHNMQPSTARTSEIARYARLGQAVSLLSPLLSFRAFHRDIRYQLNQIEEPLHRLRDFARESLFSAVFLGVCIHSYHVRELLACWFFFCPLFALLVLLILGVLATFRI
jgi:hypothetical protein